METDLAHEVREALKARKGGWKAISEETNISHSWLSQFVREKIPNPGYMTLRKLAAHMGLFDLRPRRQQGATSSQRAKVAA